MENKQIRLWGRLSADPVVKDVSGENLVFFSLYVTGCLKNFGDSWRPVNIRHNVFVSKHDLLKGYVSALKKGARVSLKGKPYGDMNGEPCIMISDSNDSLEKIYEGQAV